MILQVSSEEQAKVGLMFGTVAVHETRALFALLLE